MKLSPIIFYLYICAQKAANGFFVDTTRHKPRSLHMAEDEAAPRVPRAPTAEEVEIMDEMIDKLAEAAPYDLPNAVRRAFRVVSSVQFLLQIAARVDAASTEEEKQKFIVLAENLTSTLKAVESTAQDQLDERAKQVQTIVTAAAEEDGEFLVPLSPERLASMRSEVSKLEVGQMDEAFLTTIDSWMNKAYKDGMDGMVEILRQALQMVAAQTLQVARGDEKDGLTVLLEADSGAWDSILAKEEDLANLLTITQRATEIIVLSQESGSMLQRIQAEFMQELMKRIEALQK